MSEEIKVGDTVEVIAHSSVFKFRRGIVKDKDYAENPNLDPAFGVMLNGETKAISFVEHELERREG